MHTDLLLIVTLLCGGGENKVKTMAADVLVPYGARSSTAMVLTIDWALVCHEEGFQLPVSFQ